MDICYLASPREHVARRVSQEPFPSSLARRVLDGGFLLGSGKSPLGSLRCHSLKVQMTDFKVVADETDDSRTGLCVVFPEEGASYPVRKYHSFPRWPRHS